MTTGQRSAARDGDTSRPERVPVDPFDPVALAARLAEARVQRAAALASGRPAPRALRLSPSDEQAAAEGFVPSIPSPESSARSAPVLPAARLLGDPEGRIGGTRSRGLTRAEPAAAPVGRARVAAAFVAGSLTVAAAVLVPGLLQEARRGVATEAREPPAPADGPNPTSVATAAPASIGSILTDATASDPTSVEAIGASLASDAVPAVGSAPLELAPPAVAAAQPEPLGLDTLAALQPDGAFDGAGVPEPLPPVDPRVPRRVASPPAAALAGAADGRALTQWVRGTPTSLTYAVSPNRIVGAGAIADLDPSWAVSAAPSSLVESGARVGANPVPDKRTAVSAEARFAAALGALPTPGPIGVWLDLEAPPPAAALAPRPAATASRPTHAVPVPTKRQATIDPGEQRAVERRVERLLREQLRELRRR